MDQILLANSPRLPPAPLPTLSASDLFQPSHAHVTTSVHLPPQALAKSPFERAHSQHITFARTDLSPEQLGLLPDIPHGGTIAVVVDLDWTSGYVDEDQPPRIMLAVGSDGVAVYPLDDVWSWLGVEWYPEATFFDQEQEAEKRVDTKENIKQPVNL